MLNNFILLDFTNRFYVTTIYTDKCTRVVVTQKQLENSNEIKFV